LFICIYIYAFIFIYIYIYIFFFFFFLGSSKDIPRPSDYILFVCNMLSSTMDTHVRVSALSQRETGPLPSSNIGLTCLGATPPTPPPHRLVCSVAPRAERCHRAGTDRPELAQGYSFDLMVMHFFKVHHPLSLPSLSPSLSPPVQLSHKHSPLSSGSTGRRINGRGPGCIPCFRGTALKETAALHSDYV